MSAPGKRSSQVLAAIVLLAVGVTALPSLSGCSGVSDIWRTTYLSLANPAPGLDEQAAAELERFHEALLTRTDGANATRALRHFDDAFKRVRANYVEPVDDSSLITAAIAALETDPDEKVRPKNPDQYVDRALHRMVASLDPHSGYLDADEYRDINISTKGEFGGLGIRVSMDLDRGAVQVIAPIEDTPADRAGVEAGDLIVAIDGRTLSGLDLTDAVRLMRGAPGTDIRLSIEREGVDPFEITITRAVIKIKAVRWRVEGDIGYVRVSSFNRKVSDGIARAILDLNSQYPQGLSGLVLDLRNNPGGLLDQSLALSDAFLDDGLIVSVRGRDQRDDRIYEAEDGDLSSGLPLVVLINGGSASASEIVASALKDNRRALVMGTKSFGKGSVQTITPLAQLGALRLTTALYYGPDGHSIQAKGVTPDIVVRPTPEAANDNIAEVDQNPRGTENSRRRESDLTGAFPAEQGEFSHSSAALDESSCPSVGEEKDHLLGCAILYLKEGSTAKFLQKIGAQAALNGGET